MRIFCIWRFPAIYSTANENSFFFFIAFQGYDGHDSEIYYWDGGGIDDSSRNNSLVPEPTTMLLLGTGLFGVAGAARRKKKNQT